MIKEEICYPIKFKPIIKEKVWGGNKLISKLSKKPTTNRIGESWELSGIENENSIAVNGALKGKSITELIKKYKGDFLGQENFKLFGSQFPLLFKFIDAKEDLSIQLHPNDKIAKERHNSFGKTEMWYVLESENNKAKIFNGFCEKVDKEKYVSSFNKASLLNLINVDKVQEGDAFIINSGVVHAIGKGVLLAEIQQTSDVTYRIYDWDRGVKQHGRELHLDLSIEAIDYSKVGSSKLNYGKDLINSNIVSCEYFVTNRLNLKKEYQRVINTIDSFVVYMCVGGEGYAFINGKKIELKNKETVLIPALVNLITFVPKNGNLILLEVYID